VGLTGPVRTGDDRYAFGKPMIKLLECSEIGQPDSGNLAQAGSSPQIGVQTEWVSLSKPVCNGKQELRRQHTQSDRLDGTPRSPLPPGPLDLLFLPVRRSACRGGSSHLLTRLSRRRDRRITSTPFVAPQRGIFPHPPTCTKWFAPFSNRRSKDHEASHCKRIDGRGV